jgi:hypothetical protein
MEVESMATCPCGTNEDLVVMGISAIFQWRDGELAWVVECWGEAHDSRPSYYIDDIGRDDLFGAGWRNKT